VASLSAAVQPAIGVSTKKLGSATSMKMAARIIGWLARRGYRG